MNDQGVWLVLDTAAPRAIVGVVDVGRGAVVAEVWLPETRLHAERLPGAVQEMLKVGSIVGIGVGIGPGSFIGLRTGIAFAKGLGRALGVPVVGVPSLWALASSFQLPPGPCVAVLDARRGEYYTQVFSAEARGDGADMTATLGPPSWMRPLSEPTAVVPAQVPRGGVVVGVGGGPGLEQPGPSAGGMLRVLQQRLPCDDERSTLAPVYVRAPDAKLPALDPARHRPVEVP